MYSAWSLLRTVRLAPSWPRCRRATFSSSSFGRRYTLFWYLDLVLSLPASLYSRRISSWASVWLVNELDMTNDGWPVAQPRLSRRPSAKMMTPWPSGKMQLFFILAMCSRVIMSLLPVVVMTMSTPAAMASSIVATMKPSMHACRAQIGSISETYVIADAAFIDWAEPLPTSPKPQMSAFLPASMTSVARMMPSGSEWRQPYTLSNFDFVTQSLTLIAGKSSSPLAAISFSLCTPVVVSSLTPLQLAAIRVYLVLSVGMESLSSWRMHLNSALSVEAGSGKEPSFAYFSSNSLPLCIKRVASPPSSINKSHPSAPGTVIICSVHRQYSGKVSPFQAKTVEVPALAMAAAAWSWVLKMLQEHQRTLAPPM